MWPQGQHAHYLLKKNSDWIQVFNVSLNHEIRLQSTQHSNVEPGSSMQSVRVRCHFLSNYYAALCGIAGWLAGVPVSQVPGCVCEPSTPRALWNGRALPVWPFAPSSSHTCLGGCAITVSMGFSKKRNWKEKKKQFPYLKRSFVSYL